MIMGLIIPDASLRVAIHYDVQEFTNVKAVSYF